jgi:hypothetical protein
MEFGFAVTFNLVTPFRFKNLCLASHRHHRPTILRRNGTGPNGLGRRNSWIGKSSSDAIFGYQSRVSCWKLWVDGLNDDTSMELTFER